MHPRTFLDSFWRNDLRNEVFVAMPFRDDFVPRWDTIIRPAIEDEPLLGLALKGVRVDTRKSGDSILTDIADGVAHSQLILADISVTDRWQIGDSHLHARNGNVMYEVGLAMACRQPIEVLLVRDDVEPLLFDVSPIPVLSYDPSDSAKCISGIRQALIDRLRERELVKDLRVAATREALSQFELNLIRANRHLSVFSWEGPSLPAAVAMALPSLLQKRVLRLVAPATGDRPDAYDWTTFGRVIADSLPSLSSKPA
jgi:hypothetical protein